jgi:NitT/TauT family transport system substrate-binding protein
VDIAGGQYPSYIATQAKGLAQMRILAAGFALGPRVNEILAPATGSVHSLADLKGKTIAVNVLNSEGADLIYSSLKRHGITPAQVHLVAMPFPAMLPALAIAASNHAVLAQVLATALHLSPKITGVMATGTFPTRVNPAQIQRVANLMLQYGQLKQPLNVKQMIEG